MSFSIREVTSDIDPLLGPMLELFVESFHAWGREPVATLVQQIRLGERQGGPQYRHWIAESGGSIAGMVRGAYLSDPGAGFVVHIATASGFRGQGVAKSLIQHAHDAYAESAQGIAGDFAGTLFEVERLQDAENDEHFEENRERLQFFTRIGVERLSASYTQPALGSWLPPMPLNLFLKPSGAPFDRVKLIEGFYRQAFGLRSDHPLVVRSVLDPDAQTPVGPLR